VLIGLSPVGKAVPCLFALLPDKEKSTYLRLAECIMQQLQQADVSTIMMDYERGMNSAFRATFDEAAIVGCDFHWKTIIRRRLASDGLMALYNEDSDFQHLVRLIWALAYVPELPGRPLSRSACELVWLSGTRTGGTTSKIS
jgi:hypothetical protein